MEGFMVCLAARVPAERTGDAVEVARHMEVVSGSLMAAGRG